MAATEPHDRHAVTAPPPERVPRRRIADRERVVLWLVAIAGISIAVRIELVGAVSGPWIFMDELGYHRLAYSIGQSGEFRLLSAPEGLSYAPLYPAILAPIYALGASAEAAYEWSKIVNAVLMSLALFPIYRIARFVLPPRASLVVVALSAVAPLMFYTALAMSESLAYPLFLLAVWALLLTVRTPSVRADAFVLVAIVAATAARTQLVVLYPVALTAVILAAAIARAETAGVARRAYRSLRRHTLLVGSGALVAVGVIARGIVSGDPLSVAGRYAAVGTVDVPSAGQVLAKSLQHLAGLDLAVGAIPFAGALIAAYMLVTRGARRDAVVFASVALSATLWLLVEVGYNAAAFAGGADLPRISERYLFYVVPFFLVALVAAVCVRGGRPPLRVYLAAGALTALLPAAIPFGSVINRTIAVDSFGLQLFGKATGPRTIVAISNARVVAIVIAAVLALGYVLLRQRPRGVAAVVALVFVLMSALVGARMVNSAEAATQAVLPPHRDWVDRSRPAGDVVLIGGGGVTRLALLATAFHNLSITRVYYTCARAFIPGNDFDERRLTVDAGGHFRDGAQVVTARYAVVPARFGLRGRVVARNPKGGLVLVAAPSGRLSVPRDRVSCA